MILRLHQIQGDADLINFEYGEFKHKAICGTKVVVPEGGLEPPIFGLGDRRLIHWATRALLEVTLNKASLPQLDYKYYDNSNIYFNIYTYIYLLLNITFLLV